MDLGSVTSLFLLSSWTVLLLFHCSAGGFNIGSGSPHDSSRSRRQAPTVEFIDLLVVVDHVMFQKWLDGISPTVDTTQKRTEQADALVKRYTSLVIHQANDRLSTMQRHLNLFLQLKITAFRINVPLASKIAANPSTGRKSAEAVLVALRDWVLTSDLATSTDHVLLFTGYDLEDSSEGSGMIAGKAYVGTLCNRHGLSVSVVEDMGGFQSSYTVAHELAHTLGALHDGEKNTCTKEDRYLMASLDTGDRTTDNLDHPWYLSVCSASNISQFVQRVRQNDGNCLKQTSPAVREFTSTEHQVAGQVYTADDQCRQLMGHNSKVCLGGSFGQLSDICSSMNCLVPGSITKCSRFFAGEGTSCDSRKWCRMGQCKESQHAPVIQNPNCAHGDHIIPVNGKNCSDAVTSLPSICYDVDIRTGCCQSCANIRREGACPYGNRKSKCNSADCDHIYPNGDVYAENCCETCSHNAGKSCVDVTSTNGQSCEDLVKADGIQNCYSSSVAIQCCATCTRLQTGGKGCEYGDQDLSCSFMVTDNMRCSPQEKTKCCRTCRNDPNVAGQDRVSLSLVFFTSAVVFIFNKYDACPPSD